MKNRHESVKDEIGRRQFLTYTGAMAVGSVVIRKMSGDRPVTHEKHKIPEWLKEALKYRKIDAHNHVRPENLKNFIKAADRLGIEKVAISIPRGDEPHEFQQSNDIVLKMMQEYPDRLLGQCFINPAYPKAAMDEMHRCFDKGMIGLGELYNQVKINDPLYYPIIEKCIELQAPILMHVNADLGLLRDGFRTAAPSTTSIPDDFSDIGKRYPEAMIIHAHIGGGGDWEYMCKMLRDVPSIYVDTGGSVTDEGMIDFAVQHLGVERILFATDINFESGVGKILSAQLTEKERQKIFWDNFNNILRKRGNHAD